MRISELSRATQVPVATLKYYLREGLLHRGRVLSRTQADYDAGHVERVRLVRALTEVGGLSLAATARVLQVVDGPEPTSLEAMAAAQSALLEQDDRTGPTPRATALLERLGWDVADDDPALGRLERACEGCEQAGLGLDRDRLVAYARAVETVARIDVGSVPSDPEHAVRQVVLGTLLTEPVLAALRLLAQQHVAVTTPSPSADPDLGSAEQPSTDVAPG